MLDVNFDFTSDTPHAWDKYAEDTSVLAGPSGDPDCKSKTLRAYHQFLWSKELPDGEIMQLEDGKSRFYLKWKDMYFGSDSIAATFRYCRMEALLKEVAQHKPNYKQFMETTLRRLYTIGGCTIFPQVGWGMNRARGCRWEICDRFDLTLECIRRFYKGESSPLDKALENSRAFFELFVDFKGYVDFFFFQDCVTEDYSEVKLWLNTPLFEKNPLPKDVNSYLNWVDSQLDFVEKRNTRIEEYLKNLETKECP